jgi:hypothetical protein
MNSPTDSSYRYFKDLWRNELHRFRLSLDRYKMALPDTCVFEWHHAITHIAIAYNHSNPNLADRSKDLKSACDHVRRSH